MWSLRGTKEGSEEEANQLWGDLEGTCRKLPKGLPVGNAFLLCLILYKTMCFFSSWERLFSRVHLDLNRSKKDGIQKRHPLVKNRQRWKNNQVRKRETKEQVCILGRKKLKMTVTQNPWEKRGSQSKEGNLWKRWFLVFTYLCF